MSSHIPNEIMRQNNRITKLDIRHLPNVAQAVHLYELDGGHLSDETGFGNDPIADIPAKCSIRTQAFLDRYPSMDGIFHSLVNLNSGPFENCLLFFITYRLSRS